MATTSARHIGLARNLPPPLQRFFAANPPRAFTASLSSRTQSDGSKVASDAIGANSKPNPFLPHKNPVTGRWNPPIYSLRRQADLVNMARSHGVEELLPFSPKLTRERERKRDEHSERIVNAGGSGKRAKGHIWERTLKNRLEKRRQAMLAMPQMIQDWKQRGHGRGWKKWPR